MAQIKRIFIICGEASGDLNAASLVKEILRINPGIKISGVGGNLLKQAGVEIYCDIKSLSVIGFFDVLKKLPKFFALQKLILEKIKEEKPEAIILVDFSGFNLRLARKINRAIPTFYYISPQVWASRPGRIKTLKKYIHKIITIFKFEEEFYKKYGIDTLFVGNPLLDIVESKMTKQEFCYKYNLPDSKTTIALLPGSRRQEIKHIFPIMLEAALLVTKDLPDAQFVIAKSPEGEWPLYNRLIHGLRLDSVIIEGLTYDCLAAADFALVASGTATVETAIMQKPFVIIYKMGLLNYLLYRPLVRTPYIGMVNIIAKRKVIPEFIQFQAKPKKISKAVLKILKDPSLIGQMKEGLNQVKSLLGEKGASLRTAKIILDFLAL